MTSTKHTLRKTINIRNKHCGHNLLYSGSTKEKHKTLLQEVVTTIWSDVYELLSCIFNEIVAINRATHEYERCVK